MKLYSIAIFVFLSNLLWVQKKPYVSEVWVADNRDGTYKNPIIYTDYSAPVVVRVKDDYDMTVSSFNAAPGLPLLHSKSMVKIKDPYGKWDEPVLVIEGKGIIHTCPLWDDNGDAWAGSRTGVKSLLTVNKMNPEGTKVIDRGIHVYNGHNLDSTIEGSKFYKRNCHYYIFALAGDFPTDWQVALRSKNIYDPYERKVVLEQGNTQINGSHQGAWVMRTQKAKSDGYTDVNYFKISK